MRKLLMILSILLAATAAGYSQQVSFKLTGGPAWLNGDDYNRAVLGENGYLKNTAQTMSGAYEELKNGMNAHFEIINYFGPRLGVGFGIDYDRFTNTSSVTTKASPADGSFDATSACTPSLGVISFSLNVHYRIPLAARWKLDIFAGPVFHISQFDFENHLQTSEASLDQIESFTASSTALGFEGGLGLHYELSRGITLIADVFCRTGELSEIQGNWAVNGTSTSGTISTSSDSYYLWVYSAAASGGSFTRLGLNNSNGPGGPAVSGAKKAVLNLSGMSLTAGVKLNI